MISSVRMRSNWNSHTLLVGVQNYIDTLKIAWKFLTKLYICTEKAMATHSSTLAWKIPWTEEPGRLQFMGLLGVGHD